MFAMIKFVQTSVLVGWEGGSRRNSKTVQRRSEFGLKKAKTPIGDEWRTRDMASKNV